MTITQTISSPTNKMNIVKAMLALHKVKRFGKAKSEPAFQVFRRHPVTRGMASYLYIWPLGCVIQQTISSQEKYDWWKIIRFGIYGALITAPCLYAWVRLSTSLYPNTNLRIGCAKVRYTMIQNLIKLNSHDLLFKQHDMVGKLFSIRSFARCSHEISPNLLHVDHDLALVVGKSPNVFSFR